MVIQDVTSYITEANRQLSNKTFYKKLDNDPSKRHQNIVNNNIDDLKNEGLISEKLSKSLKATDCKTPKFYLLPKIHKVKNPGRPVISSINCHTSLISEFVDQQLQPHVKKLPSYIQDTTDYINKTKNIPVPENSILVIGGVLYVGW